MDYLKPLNPYTEFLRDGEQEELGLLPMEAVEEAGTPGVIRLGRRVRLGRNVKLKPTNT